MEGAQQLTPLVRHSHNYYRIILHTGSVAGAPTGVTVGIINGMPTLVSWTAPTGSPPTGGYLYELFYETAAADSRLSGGTTNNTVLPLTGLTLGETYTIFVVASGVEGAPVFPSVHSNKITINPSE